MTKIDETYFLICLIEECAEVQQAATKCLRFGIDRTENEYGNNREVLSSEVGDLLGVIDEVKLNTETVESHRTSKLSRIQKYLHINSEARKGKEIA